MGGVAGGGVPLLRSPQHMGARGGPVWMPRARGLRLGKLGRLVLHLPRVQGGREEWRRQSGRQESIPGGGNSIHKGPEAGKQGAPQRRLAGGGQGTEEWDPRIQEEANRQVEGSQDPPLPREGLVTPRLWDPEGAPWPNCRWGPPPPSRSAPVSVPPQQLHRLAGRVDLRLLRAHAAGLGPLVLLGNELRRLQGLPGAVGPPRTMDETGPPAVGRPRPAPAARAARPAAPASPGAAAAGPPGRAHAAGRGSQPAADDVPEFVRLVSGRDRGPAAATDGLSLTSLRGAGSRLPAGVGAPIAWSFAYLVCQGGFQGARADRRPGKRVRARGGNGAWEPGLQVCCAWSLVWEGSPLSLSWSCEFPGSRGERGKWMACQVPTV